MFPDGTLCDVVQFMFQIKALESTHQRLEDQRRTLAANMNVSKILSLSLSLSPSHTHTHTHPTHTYTLSLSPPPPNTCIYIFSHKLQIRGWLFKRGLKGPTANVWRRRYFRCDQGSRICYYKSSAEGTPQG